jgi:hypothetical protein
MNALVVFESLYGNTAMIAEHVARGLRTRGMDARAVALSDVEAHTVADVDLLVVGGPTHAHGMTRHATRKAAGDDEKNTFDHPTVDPGLRGWLDAIPRGDGRLCAAFDTRFDRSTLLVGSAAKGIAKRLEARGYRRVVGPESFFVTKENVLEAGQLERASRWAADLAESSRAPSVAG